ncbi:hypothetical protein HYX07_00880 [Candidatus Woesearchaeota archaeon]|nr:hypothetical protein [Candidatus Woesearchaeota archaeon]
MDNKPFVCPYSRCNNKEFKSRWGFRSHLHYKHPSFDTIIGLISIILAIVFFIFGSKFSYLQFLDVQNSIENFKEDIKNTTIESKNEILFTLIETDSLGIPDEKKDIIFRKKYNLSYQQVRNILIYSSRTDDEYLAFNSLFFGAYAPSLYHFDIALYKKPRIDLNIGKSAALIGLNRTSEAKGILFSIQNNSENQKFIYKLIGDAYCYEGNYSECGKYYLFSLDKYFESKPPWDTKSLNIITRLCEGKAIGVMNIKNVYVVPFDSQKKLWCKVQSGNYTFEGVYHR